MANPSLAGFDRDADDGNCGNTFDAFLPYHQAICASVSAGVTYVVAAGNSCDDAANWYPAAYDEVITVSAMADTDGRPGGLGPAPGSGILNCAAVPNPNRDDTFAAFSNSGPDVDLSAPGVDVLSTLPGGAYGRRWGTSMAAPYVAGAAALYLAAHPDASPEQVRTALVAKREPGPLPNDRDGFDEGVLNVNDRQPWGDITPPTGPVVSIAEDEADEHAVGSTLYYNPANGHEGQYSLVVDTTDPESGVDQVAFPSLLGVNAAVDAVAPYERAYRWTDADTKTVTKQVVATNSDGLTASSPITVVADRTNPTVEIGTPAAASPGITIPLDASDQAGSGVNRVEVRWCRGAGCRWADGIAVGSDAAAPYEIAWAQAPTTGTYTVVAKAWDNVGRVSDSDSVVVRTDGGVLSTADPAQPDVRAPAEAEAVLAAVTSDTPAAGRPQPPKHGKSRGEAKRRPGHERRPGEGDRDRRERPGGRRGGDK